MRLPPYLAVLPGNYQEVIAGSTEETHLTGPISETVYRAKPPDKRYFNKAVYPYSMMPPQAQKIYVVMTCASREK